MAGKVAIVTGSSTGIGRATAILLARQGAKVVLAARRDLGGEVAQAIREEGGDALFVKTDVSQASQVRSLVGACIETYGRLDIAINNAGIEGTVTPLTEYREEDWDEIVGINLKGVWLCMKHEAPAIARAGGGAIVNVASIAGQVGFPLMGPYVATKHGVIGLTRTAAHEFAAQKIRVNAVCPGLTDTPLADRFVAKASAAMGADAEQFFFNAAPFKRRATPEELAETLIWLCTEGASYVTGHALVVDGGYLTI